MKITLEQVKKTAAMAKLPLADDELAEMAGQLQEFLDYVKVLKKLPSGTGSPLQAFGAPGPAGQGEACLSQEEVLALAPDSSQGMVRVPRVIADE